MKLSFTVMFLLLILNLFGQRRKDGVWVDVALKGSGGITHILNKNISADPNVKAVILSPNYSYGIRIGFFINEITSISAEASELTYIQKYDITQGGHLQDLNYTKNLEFIANDIALIFRLNTYLDTYFEAGPRLSWIKSLTVSNSIDTLFTDIGKEGFKERTTSLLIGAGITVFKSRGDRLRINIGGRFYFTFDDVLTDISNPPVKDGLYEMNVNYLQTYNDIVGTRPLLFQAVFELNYFFGYYGRTKRGRTKMRLFR